MTAHKSEKGHPFSSLNTGWNATLRRGCGGDVNSDEL